MIRRLMMVTVALLLCACAPVRAVGNTAIGAGQVALGVADIVI